MLKILNSCYLFIVFAGLSSFNAMSMQKENFPSDLIQTVCKSINDHISKNLNPEEAVKWIESKCLPGELKEIVKRELIKLNYNNLKSTYFTQALSLAAKVAKPANIAESISLLCLLDSINSLEKTLKFGLFNYNTYKLFSMYSDLLFIVKPNNTLYICNSVKKECIGQIANFKGPNYTILVNSDHNAILAFSNGEITTLYLDAQTGKYKEDSLEEVVYLISYCNALKNADSCNISHDNNDKSTCILS